METRKNLPRAVLARIYHIDREIASGKYPNANDLAQSYECGVATIHRDIEYMRYFLYAPIEYCAKNRGWYYEEKSFRLPARFASANDMLALGMAKSLLTLYKDTPLYESAQRLLKDITAPLSSEEVSDVQQAAWYEKRIIVPPIATVPIKNEIWEIIIDAMKENKVITFEYKGIWDDDYKVRLVCPYQLLFDNGTWYLYGYSEERSDIRFFALSRMKNISIPNENFKLPKNFDYCSKNDGSYFGVFIGKKMKYKIEFSSYIAPVIQERKWTKDQKITDTKKGIVIEFSSTQLDKVFSWVLSYGIDARPIEPPELVNRWNENIIALYKKAKI